MARLMPIDFDAAVFGPGRFVQSGIHATAVLAHRNSDEGGAPVYDIYMPRSFAASLWDFVTTAALPLGFRVEANG
jgi:sarcosine oxidase gamma subunit